MPVDDYFKETVRLMRAPTLLEQLRAMVEAAEEIEARDVHVLDAWQNDEDWQRLGRITLLLIEVKAGIEACMGPEQTSAWRERVQKRLSIRRVK